MDTTILRYFSRVYEEQSINRAARRLFITPQGLSKAIRNLEKELGTELFLRCTNGMVPTESGVYLYENSVSLMQKLDEIEIGVRRFADRSHTVKVGFACGVLNRISLQKMEECRHSYPRLRIQWEEGYNREVIDRVLRGLVDLGVVVGTVSKRDLSISDFSESDMQVLVYPGHPFYERKSLSVGDLKGEPLITLNENFYCYHSLIQRCRDFEFTPNIVLKTMEDQLIYRFCREKIGLGIDANIHGAEIGRGDLRCLKLSDAAQWKNVIIVRKERKEERMIQEVIEFLERIKI